MKKVFLILTLILTTKLVLAECVYYFHIFPQKREISPNSLFMIECNFDLQNIIDSLHTKYAIYLQDENMAHKIKLSIQEKLKGQDEVSQVILKPDETLKLNHIYSIHIDSLNTTQYKRVVNNYSKVGIGNNKYWSITKSKDLIPPKFLQEPLFISKEVYSFGHGNCEYAIFDLEIEDDNEVMIKTELVSVDNNQIFIFYLHMGKEDKLFVGKNICEGAFLYEKGNKYKVRFSLLDLAGNYNNTYTKWTEFEAIFERK